MEIGISQIHRIIRVDHQQLPRPQMLLAVRAAPQAKPSTAQLIRRSRVVLLSTYFRRMSEKEDRLAAAKAATE